MDEWSYVKLRCFVQIFEVVVEDNDLQDEQKAKICKKLAEADKVCCIYFHVQLFGEKKKKFHVWLCVSSLKFYVNYASCWMYN